MMIRLVNIVLVALILMVPTAAFAGDAGGVWRLIGLPGEPYGNISTEVYLGALYQLAIGIAALLAVVKLILAGAKYILTDVVTQKADAKRDVRTAIIGLLIVLSAVLILTTINPNLINLSRLDNLDGVSIPLLQAPSARVPERLTPSEGQDLDVIPCTVTQGLVDCDAAMAQCRASQNVIGVPTRHENQIYCYTVQESAADSQLPVTEENCPDEAELNLSGTCDEPEIELGEDWEDRRGDLRAGQCQLLGSQRNLRVEYDNATGRCLVL